MNVYACDDCKRIVTEDQLKSTWKQNTGKVEIKVESSFWGESYKLCARCAKKLVRQAVGLIDW